MLSILIAAVLKLSPLIGAALKSPIRDLLIHVIAHKFGKDPKDFDGITKVLESLPNAKGVMEDIENEHGDVLKMFQGATPVGSQPPMMEMTIVQKFYYGDHSHGREQPQEPQGQSEN